MKRIYFSLLAIIFSAIVIKTNTSPIQAMDYAALSTDTKVENVDQFFKYKVNHIQFDKKETIINCSVKSAICCHA
ncbi:hypothetical protein [Gramella sp. MAR_2010_147]|uniref:hypothetical protein n=1 Tax=Gramella sp. MAR_2010_147 TaxID=1250205 RepID=UPI000879FFE2|nr:hypothetical protein [Gramella sp. MAR_2010_147]SDR96525.1 hypothetical protein SAMN04488553_1146 [Gramella sp. MAR_2010_147]